ncbi:glutamate receptor 1-like [Harmonia axyridis]|uniref:glutamate receptor 1-like n=1 Tax=Harmonia axyridis TaxID=115357 RepID=UPI001E279617|nr:glutamate receptor 1-like [Harmonia axyridis]
MTHIDSSPRFTYLITHILISIFNITPKYIIQTSYGSPIPNSKEYTGIIGDVQSGRAVMGATPVFFLDSRVHVVEYIAPNTKSYLNFYFKSPPLSYVSNIFVKPFNEYVWYSCFILIGLTLATMFTISKWEWTDPYFRRQIKRMPDATKPAISDVAILQLGVISQQGSDTELKSSSGRIAMIFALIAFMFLYTAYAANIVAILQSTSDSIKELKDLLASGMELGVEKAPYIVNLFKNVSSPIGREIIEKRLKPKGDKFLMPLSEGTDKMRSQFFAFFTEPSSINKLMSDYFDEAEKCNVRYVEYTKVMEPWFITQKNGCYKELLKVGLLRLRELGFYMAERKRIFHENPTCFTRLSRFFSAGLIDTYPGFLFFGVGCLLGLLIFFVEVFVERRKKAYRKKKQQSNVYFNQGNVFFGTKIAK